MNSEKNDAKRSDDESPTIPPRRNPSGVPYPVHTTQLDECSITYKNDGFDYIGLYKQLRAGTYPVKTLLYDDPEHYVYLVEKDGRKFVFKRFGELDGKFDTKLWRFFAGPFYSTLLRKVNAAVANGCDVIPDMYLIAENIHHRLAYDNYILVEFVEGQPLDLVDISPYRGAVLEAFSILHAHNLSLGNVKDGNLILTPDRTIKIIDLSNRGSQIMGRAKDAIKVRRLWGIEIPVHSFCDGTARIVMQCQFAVTKARRYVKRKLGMSKGKRNDWFSKIKH